MKAVIYARYSSDNQREESIEGQIRECTAFAEKNDITILKHYIDRAYSARTDNRPEFQAMIKDSDKRLFDMVIVWKLDRFSRDRYDSTRYKLQLKKNGVKVVSATEQISEGAEGIILESVLEGYAEYYSADLAEKVHRGMTENALKGKCNGGTRPVGYIIDAEQHFQPDPVTAPFVLEAFKRYAEGSTMKEIAAFFKENGIRNTLGGEIKPGSIQRMLNNRRYIGEYSYKDVIVPNVIPAIVPQDLFDRVQDMMAKNKKAPARHKAEDDYLLTTKLFCGYCGAYLCGECGTSRSGAVHHYYKCVSVKKRRADCKKKAVRSGLVGFDDDIFRFGNAHVNAQVAGDIGIHELRNSADFLFGHAHGLQLAEGQRLQLACAGIELVLGQIGLQQVENVLGHAPVSQLYREHPSALQALYHRVIRGRDGHIDVVHRPLESQQVQQQSLLQFSCLVGINRPFKIIGIFARMGVPIAGGVLVLIVFFEH